MTARLRRFRRLVPLFFVALLLAGVQGAAGSRLAPTKADAIRVLGSWATRAATGQVGSERASAPSASRTLLNNFEVVGHHDLGDVDTNGDVWVHGNFAYVGTWAVPCNGRGVKIVDVSDPGNPKMIGLLASRRGTSAEDMVVRHVSTPFFTGDLLATGIQRCGDDPALDSQEFGVDFWDVTDPYHPVKLSFLGVTHGDGGVHELDLFQRGGHVYALLATPFTEFFDPVPGGDFRIVDVTNPSDPVQVGEWGAFAHGLVPGPFFGQGSFGASFDHSVRASADGTRAYVSYWDLGVLTLDITDVSDPVLLTRTKFASDADGDAHSVSFYQGKHGAFLLQNDEDFDPESPSHILYGATGHGIGNPTPGAPPLWLLPGHALTAPVVEAANQGCSVGDYPAGTSGKIAVVRTIDEFEGSVGGEVPECLEQEQEAAAESAGAAAVVHDWISDISSPQWFDFLRVHIPVLFTGHHTAQGMVAAGSATLQGQQPSWGYLRAYDPETGVQLAKFDALPNVHTLPAPDGAWSIHNNEVLNDRSYASWYSNGIVALDLKPLDKKPGKAVGDPALVGQFVPPGARSHAPGVIPDGPLVWGVAVPQAKKNDALVYASDMNGGLWIVRPTKKARP